MFGANSFGSVSFGQNAPFVDTGVTNVDVFAVPANAYVSDSWPNLENAQPPSLDTVSTTVPDPDFTVTIDLSEVTTPSATAFVASDHTNQIYNSSYHDGVGSSIRRIYDVSFPPGPPPPNGYKVMYFVHGGSWVGGNEDVVNTVHRDIALTRGYVFISCQYKLSQAPDGIFATVFYNTHSHPQPVQDIICAISKSFTDYDLDPDNMIITGYSAGGHTALQTALTLNDNRQYTWSYTGPAYEYNAFVGGYVGPRNMYSPDSNPTWRFNQNRATNLPTPRGVFLWDPPFDLTKIVAYAYDGVAGTILYRTVRTYTGWAGGNDSPYYSISLTNHELDLNTLVEGATYDGVSTIYQGKDHIAELNFPIGYIEARKSQDGTGSYTIPEQGGILALKDTCAAHGYSVPSSTPAVDGGGEWSYSGTLNLNKKGLSWWRLGIPITGLGGFPHDWVYGGQYGTYLEQPKLIEWLDFVENIEDVNVGVTAHTTADGFGSLTANLEDAAWFMTDTGPDEASLAIGDGYNNATNILTGASVAPKYDTAQFITGGQSLRHTSIAATSGSLLGKYRASSATTLYSRFYMRLQSLPSQSQTIIWADDQNDTWPLHWIQVTPTGAIRLVGNKASFVTEVALSSNGVIAAGKWYQIEFGVIQTPTYQIKLRIKDLTSSTTYATNALDWWSTPQNVGGVGSLPGLQAFYWGVGSEATNTIWFDAVAVDIGPLPLIPFAYPSAHTTADGIGVIKTTLSLRPTAHLNTNNFGTLAPSLSGAPVLKTTGGSETDAIGYSTSAVSLTTGYSHFAYIYSNGGATAPPIPQVSGGGNINWGFVNSVLDSDGLRRLSLFKTNPYINVWGNIWAASAAGTNGAAVTIGNSQFTSISNGASTYDSSVAPAFDTTYAPIKHDISVSPSSLCNWNPATDYPIAYLRMRIRINAAPVANTYILQTAGPTGTAQCQIRLQTNRTLILRDNFVTRGVATPPIAIDTWYCLEMKIDNTNDVVAMRLRANDGTVISEQSGAYTGTNLDLGSVAFGPSAGAGNATSAWNLFTTDHTASNVDWIGAVAPAAPSNAPVVMSFGTAQTRCDWAVVEYAGTATSTVTGATSVSAQSLLIDSGGAANQWALAGYGYPRNNGASSGSGYSELSETFGINPNGGLYTEYTSNAVADANFTQSGTAAPIVGIVANLNPPGTAIPLSPPAHENLNLFGDLTRATTRNVGLFGHPNHPDLIGNLLASSSLNINVTAHTTADGIGNPTVRAATPVAVRAFKGTGPTVQSKWDFWPVGSALDQPVDGVAITSSTSNATLISGGGFDSITWDRDIVGVTGDPIARFVSAANASGLRYTTGALPIGWARFAFRYASGINTGSCAIFHTNWGADTNGNVSIYAFINLLPNNQIYLYDALNSTAIALSPEPGKSVVTSPNTWYQYEFSWNENTNTVQARLYTQLGTLLGTSTYSGWTGGSIDRVFLGCRPSIGTAGTTFYLDAVSVSSTNWLGHYSSGFGQLSRTTPRTIGVTAHTTADGFGLPAITRGIRPTAYSDADAFGSIKYTVYVFPTAHTTADLIPPLGVTQDNKQARTLLAYSDGDAFGNPKNSFSIKPTAFIDPSPFGNLTRTTSVGRTLTGYANHPDLIGTPSRALVLSRLPIAHSNVNRFGSLNASGSTARSLTAYSDIDRYGNHIVANRGVSSIATTPFYLGEAFIGSNTIGYGVTVLEIAPTAFVSGNAFGTQIKFTLKVAPTALGNSNNFGSLSRTTPVGRSVTGHIDPDLFGQPARSTVLVVGMVAYANTNTFALPAPNSAFRISPSAVPASQMFGVFSIAKILNRGPPAYTTADLFGIPGITTRVGRTVTAHTTVDGIGSPTVLASLTRQIFAFVDNDVFGDAKNSFGLRPTAIADADAFGVPRVAPNIKPTAYTTADGFGIPSRTTTLSRTLTGKINPNFFGTILTSEATLVAFAAHSDADAFGVPSRALGSVNRNISAHSTADAFGSLGIVQEAPTFEVIVSNMTNGVSVSNPAVTASVSPSANSGVLVVVGVSLASGFPTDELTVSGLGLTWTKVATTTWTYRRRLWLYVGTGVVEAGTISISHANSFEEVAWIVDQAQDLDQENPIVGLPGIWADSNSTGFVTPEAPALGDIGTGDVVYSALQLEQNFDAEPEAGWIPLGDTGGA